MWKELIAINDANVPCRTVPISTAKENTFPLYSFQPWVQIRY